MNNNYSDILEELRNNLQTLEFSDSNETAWGVYYCAKSISKIIGFEIDIVADLIGDVSFSEHQNIALGKGDLILLLLKKYYTILQPPIR